MIFSTVELPMLDGIIGSAFNGGSANDQSGSCVASVGDINGSDTDNDNHNDNQAASDQTSVKIHEQNSPIFRDIFSPRIQTYIP